MSVPLLKIGIRISFYALFKTISACPHFSDFNFKGKKALIRVDFNVPLNDKMEITDDNRMRAAIPDHSKNIKGRRQCDPDVASRPSQRWADRQILP